MALVLSLPFCLRQGSDLEINANLIMFVANLALALVLLRSMAGNVTWALGQAHQNEQAHSLSLIRNSR